MLHKHSHRNASVWCNIHFHKGVLNDLMAFMTFYSFERRVIHNGSIAFNMRYRYLPVQPTYLLLL